jgi:adenylosuccinate synthase
LRRCKPIYETVEGWKTDVTGVRRWRDLPSQLLKYVDFISELIGVPVEVVSVGPDREQTIFASSTKLSRMLRLSKAH